MDLGGTTVCVDDITECPVTDLKLLPADSQDPILSDPKWKTVLSSQDDTGESRQMYLAYTSESNSRSNAPLQNITMFYGTPCAFNDRRAHLGPG